MKKESNDMEYFIFGKRVKNALKVFEMAQKCPSSIYWIKNTLPSTYLDKKCP